MLKIRLKRVGRKNSPSFRVVLLDSKEAAKSGNVLENLGFYNPISKEKDLNADRIKYWISVGAKPSDTMHNMLINEKIIEGKKVNVLGKKTPIVKEVEEGEAPAEKTEEATKTAEAVEEKTTEEPKEEVAEKPKAEELKVEESKAEEPALAEPEEAVEEKKEEEPKAE